LAKNVIKARKSDDYDFVTVAKYAVEYLSEEYEEVADEVKKCEKSRGDKAAVTGTTYAATSCAMAATAVAGAGAGSMMGGMASQVQVFNAMKEATDYPPTELETVTEGFSGAGMAPESEESKQL